MQENHNDVSRTLSQRLMLSFDGYQAPTWLIDWIKQQPPAGVTLFRARNVESPEQVLQLTESLQAAALESGVGGPLLVAADQEGGQFNALGDGTTHFPGNMALGATGDPELARQVGKAIGLELKAMGVTVNYAPVCDINSNPANPNVGTRAFSDDPKLTAAMAVAMVEGMQSVGVAATAKHFPGNGGVSLDPHFGLPVLDHDADRLSEVEFHPFQAAVDAGARLVMSAHVALPQITGRPDLPATLSKQIMTGLLRDQLGFRGMVITDALDMKAISQGTGQIIDLVAAVRAGVDLLMLTGDMANQQRLFAGLQLAYDRGLIRSEHLKPTRKRLQALQDWQAFQNQERPDLTMLGSGRHLKLAKTIARRSITLVKDEAGLMPLRMEQDQRIAAIMPQPADLTPADTSSYVKPELAEMVRIYHPNVDEFLFDQRPSGAEISMLRERLAGYDLLIIGTISAHLQPEQAALVKTLLATGVPAVTVAMRTPYDLATYPQAKTHLCTYTILPVVMRELAAALWGGIQFQGRVPVLITE